MQTTLILKKQNKSLIRINQNTIVLVIELAESLHRLYEHADELMVGRSDLLPQIQPTAG